MVHHSTDTAVGGRQPLGVRPTAATQRYTQPRHCGPTKTDLASATTCERRRGRPSRRPFWTWREHSGRACSLRRQAGATTSELRRSQGTSRSRPGERCAHACSVPSMRASGGRVAWRSDLVRCEHLRLGYRHDRLQDSATGSRSPRRCRPGFPVGRWWQCPGHRVIGPHTSWVGSCLCADGDRCPLSGLRWITGLPARACAGDRVREMVAQTKRG